MYRDAPHAFQHHSRTLPAMSYVPDGLIPVNLPTGAGPDPCRLLSGSMLAPKSVPAARIQCVTVGRLLPENFANAAASYQLTPLTGYSSWPAGYSPTRQVAGPGRPVTSTNRAMASSKPIDLPSTANG